MEIQPAVIAHPDGVDGVVFARRLAIHLVFARTDDGVAARRATCADALGFLEEPDAHLETKIFRRQRADRADVHGVQRVIVVERLAGMTRDRVVTAAIDDAQRVVARDVLRETDAARAKNAALVVEHDARPEIDGLSACEPSLRRSGWPPGRNPRNIPADLHSPAWSQIGQSSG